MAVVVCVAAAGSFSTTSRSYAGSRRRFASDEEQFLFGSIGTEATDGVPYWIWLVLPRIFPEYLPGPGGYASLGVLAKDGREMPIGFSKTRIGFERVGINCAICHTGTYRLRPDDRRRSCRRRRRIRCRPSIPALPARVARPKIQRDVIMAEIDRTYACRE